MIERSSPPPPKKIVLVGEQGTGKTSIVQMFNEGIFTEDSQPTIGVGYIKACIKIDEKDVEFTVWDTAGEEKFQSLIPLYIRNATGILYVTDCIVSQPTLQLDKLYEWVNENSHDLPCILAINKSDLKNDNSSIADIQSWADKKKIRYIETSAKLNYGINEAFYELVNDIEDKDVSICSTHPIENKDENHKCSC